MAYTKTVWANGAGGGVKINASRLTHLEVDGVELTQSTAEAATTTATTASANASAATSAATTAHTAATAAQATANAAIPKSTATGKGDLLTAFAPGRFTRLPAGANDRMLTVAQVDPPLVGAALLGTWALPAADPINITIPDTTPDRSVFLLVNTSATYATPAGWTLEESYSDADVTSMLHYPAASNTAGGDIAVSLNLAVARATAIVAFECSPIEPGTMYANLITPGSGPAAVWGTQAHTFTAKESVLAIIAMQSTTASGGPPASVSVDHWDNGFTTLADTGWAGSGISVGDDAVRIFVGKGSNIGFVSNGVTMYLTGTTWRASAVGFLAFDLSTGVPYTGPAYGNKIITADALPATTELIDNDLAFIRKTGAAEIPPNIYVWNDGEWQEMVLHEQHSGAWVELEPKVRYISSGAWAT